MKAIAPLFLVLALSAQCVVAQPATPPAFDDHIDTVTVEASKGPPIIEFVTYRLNSPGPYLVCGPTANFCGTDWEFIVDIHFIAPQGNATTMHMQLLKAPSGYHVGNEPIIIPAEAQKSGTYASIHLVIGHCTESDSAMSEAFIVDAKGNHSNAVRFSTHCSVNSLPTFNEQLQVGPTKYVDTAVPHTGTEAALRTYIEGWEKGEPPAEIMSPSVATETQTHFAAIKKLIDGWGSLKSITFKTVDEKGLDTYSVEFEHGESIWSIPQLTANGKLGGLSFGPSTANTAPVAADNEHSSPVAAP